MCLNRFFLTIPGNGDGVEGLSSKKHYPSTPSYVGGIRVLFLSDPVETVCSAAVFAAIALRRRFIITPYMESTSIVFTRVIHCNTGASYKRWIIKKKTHTRRADVNFSAV